MGTYLLAPIAVDYYYFGSACDASLRSVLVLSTVIILKRVRENTFFEATNLQRGKKEVAKSLVVFNLRNIIHPFQSNKYLRIYLNLNFNQQECLIGY